MRWPLRYQIMLPMAAVMLLAVVFVEGVGALLAVRDTKADIESQVREVARIAAEANFPLTTPVLRQMRALSGAELVLVDKAGRPIAASGPVEGVEKLPTNEALSAHSGFAASRRVRVADRAYFHTYVPIPARNGDEPLSLHILFPEEAYERAWQREVFPPLVFIAVALPVVLGLSLFTASRIASRVERLRDQVDRIAEGEFEPMALPARQDELRELAVSVNRMTAQLADYEKEVRQTERMRTLAHLGGGIAHQLRNSATGCAIALDIHADECPLGRESETLSVAKRQLRLMEEYIQRFLQLGKPAENVEHAPIDLAALVDGLLPLVEPSAKHARVALQWRQEGANAMVLGSAERLSQMVINLLVNAIEAASVPDAATPALVQVEVASPTASQILLRISDTGCGPAENVQQSLFEPFVTAKPDGVGLGLSVAREIVEQHGGQIAWQRADGMTHFTVELPAAVVETARVEAIGCR
jgi:signal transduction histidine kinase